MASPNHLVRWIEIPVVRMDRAQRFYEQIFQLELRRVAISPELTMALFPAEAGQIAGALCHHPEFYEPGQTGPTIYLNGEPDLAHILDRVEAAGGRIVVPKRQISEDRGYMALFVDTEGNRIGLMSKA